MRGPRLRSAARWAASGIAVTVIAAFAPISSASAAPAPYLLISRDGATFERTTATSLFQSIGRVVPGDVQKEEIWVRSSAPSTGELRIEILEAKSDDRALAEAMTLSATAEGETGSVRLDRILGEDAPTLLVPAVSMASGAVVRIGAELSVDESLGDVDGDGGTLGTVGFRVRVTLAGLETEPESMGALPATGADPLAASLLGAGALTAGALLLAAKRRRPEHE